MGLSLDLNKVDNPTKLDSGGPVSPGRCHAVLTEFGEYEDTKNGQHIAHWEILAHDDPSQVGKVYKHYLTDPGNAVSDKAIAFSTRVLLNYSYVLGVTNAAAMEAAKKSGQQPNLDLSNGVGHQACLELVEEQYKDKDGIVKTTTKIGSSQFAVYDLSNPKCKDFPRNAAMAARATKSAPAQVTGDASEMPTQTKQETADPFATTV